MENRQLIIPANASGMSCAVCGGKGIFSYLSKLTADREIRLSAESGGKALYIGNVTVTADAPVCRIGPKSPPYPKQGCINVSTRLSVKKNTEEKTEARP